MKPTKRKLLALHKLWLKDGKLTYHSGLCQEFRKRFGFLERAKFVEMMSPFGGSAYDKLFWWGS